MDLNKLGSVAILVPFMSTQPNNREVATITVVEGLTETLMSGVVAERIRRLRVEQMLVSDIVLVLLGEFEEFRDEEKSVFTSAVYTAARQLLGDVHADEVAKANHHTLTQQQRSSGGRNSGIEERSTNGITARGERAWSLADDRALQDAIEQCEPFHSNNGCGFWYDVAKVFERTTDTTATPKSCASRAYKITRKDVI